MCQNKSMNLKAAENLRLRHHFVLIRFSQDDQGCFGFRIAVHLLISWFLFQSLTVNAQNYIEIAGNIDTIYYRSGDTNDLENSIHRIFSFACIIGTNQHNQQWQINNNFTEGSEEKWFFDGTNVYNSLHVTNPPPKALIEAVSKRVAVASFPVARSNLTICITPSPNGHPLGNLGVNVPWLAYCSGKYLKQTDRIIPLPVATIRSAPNAFAHSDITEYFEDELSLPRIIEMFTSKSLYRTSVSNYYRAKLRGISNEQVEKFMPPGYEDGVLKFHYVVTSSTNFFGWQFPVTFEYLQNDYELLNARSGKWVPRYSGTGRLTCIRTSVQPETIFDQKMDQTIVDYRFRDDVKPVDRLVYHSSAAVELQTNDPSLQKRFSKMVAITPVENSSSLKLRRWVVLFSVVSASSVSLIVIFLLNKKVKSNNTNN